MIQKLGGTGGAVITGLLSLSLLWSPTEAAAAQPERTWQVLSPADSIPSGLFDYRIDAASSDRDVKVEIELSGSDFVLEHIRTRLLAGIQPEFDLLVRVAPDPIVGEGSRIYRFTLPRQLVDRVKVEFTYEVSFPDTTRAYWVMLRDFVGNR